MDYENAYKEATGWMRKIYPTLTGTNKEDAEHYFPELKESEDERIRKSLVKFFRKFNPKDMWDEMFSFGDVLAYLEKQKEQKKPVSKYRVGPAGENDIETVELPTEYCIYQDIRKRLIALVEKFGQEEDKEEMLDYLEKYQPIESAREVKEYNFQPGDPDEKAIKRLKEMIYYACDESSDVPPDEACALDDWLDDKCKPAEWSEYDEEMISSIEQWLHEEKPEYVEKEFAWLKSLRPQSIQDKFDEAMHVADKFEEGYKAGVYDTKAKSWKPSDEQMRCLWVCVSKAKEIHNASVGGYDAYRILVSLYDELHKLL